MNILHINTLDTRGGAAQVAFQIHEACLAGGYQSHYFVHKKYSDNPHIQPIHSYYADVFQSPLRLLGRFTSKDFYSAARNLERKTHHFLANDIEGFHLTSLLNSPEYKQADIIHLHNLHGSYFPLSALTRFSARKHVVWTLHDMWAITGHCAHSLDCDGYKTGCRSCPHLDTPPALWRDNAHNLWQKKKKIYQNSKLEIVAPSQWLHQKMTGGILKDQHVSLIYNGVDNHLFKPLSCQKSLRKKYNIPEHAFVMASVSFGGINNFWKGTQYALSIMKALDTEPNIYFLDIGARRTFSEGKLIHIQYEENQSILNELYNVADCLVVTSVAENCPLMVLESMSAGLPLVSFRLGGIPELAIEGKGGFFAPAFEWNQLVIILSKLAQQPKEYLKNLGALNRKRVEQKFSLIKMNESYFNLYKHLAEPS